MLINTRSAADPDVRPVVCCRRSADLITLGCSRPFVDIPLVGLRRFLAG
jgi:hypothetical protein